MEFITGTDETLEIGDTELSGLLDQVYVSGGFTTPEEAKSLFEPSAVRARGVLIGAREKKGLNLAGMIILVPPESPARRMAQKNEAEIHLLGVRSDYRQHGLGRKLVAAAIDHANQKGYSKITLWTQIPMRSAQKLYETTGFVHVENFERNGREFKLYELSL